MDKNKLKTFAIESRRQLIEDTAHQANLLGITKDGIQDPIEEAEGMQAFDIGGTKPYVIYDDDIEKRNNLVKEVQDKGFENVIEEVAYTWFNRIIAVRYMEVNDYLPTRVRVLSSETVGKTEPDIIKEAPNINLNLTNEDIQYIYNLKNENKLDELFKFLFIKQCNKLNKILPKLFEKTEDFKELLLSINFSDDNGIVRNLINYIPAEDFKESVEIIGWFYQYYNTELKDETFELLKNKNVKVTKNRLPAVTQIFTPDWVVKYMVENSLGRIWLESNPNSNLKNKWQYYLDSNINKGEPVNIEDIKIIDPCMGSGHILVYVFEVLMQIYESKGYSKRDAALLILENNIYGIDINKRAYQLSYFSLMMKARLYHKNIFNEDLELNLSFINDSNYISDEFIKFVNTYDSKITNDLNYLVKTFHNASEFGSIININYLNFDYIFKSLNNIIEKSKNDLRFNMFKKEFKLLYSIIFQSKILYSTYDVVITNPPYMGSKRMNKQLSDYVKQYYPNSKSDLYSVFIEKCGQMTKLNGFFVMITQQSWMYLNSFKELRNNILKNYEIDNILHLGANVFEELKGEVVQSCSFLIKNNTNIYNKPLVINLKKFKSSIDKKVAYLDKNYDKYSLLSQQDYLNLPDSFIAYQLNTKTLNMYNKENLIGNYFNVNRGPSLSSNKLFLRKWYEVNFENIFLNKGNLIEKKWYLCTRSGSKFKWYVNVDEVINKNILPKISNYASQNKKGIVWPDARFGSPYISARVKEEYYAYESGVNLIETDNDNDIYTLMAYFNSYIYQNMLSDIVNGQHFSPIYIKKLPYTSLENINEDVLKIINLLKELEKTMETSIFFETCIFNQESIEKSYLKLKYLFEKSFAEINSLENSINYKIENILGNRQNNKTNDKYFIDIIDENKYVKNLISYIIGCIFGRYDYKNNKINFAGNKWDENFINSIIIDEDNIIPILDSEYFDDDIVKKFTDFIELYFGNENLENNLNFIAGALKKRGNTSRDIIRNYFLSDFFNDHKKEYQKCPIYWQFDSGKENGFKCLIYMHRYTPDLVARVRTDYLHKTQKAIESQIFYQQNIKKNSGNSKDQARADKRIKKLTRQLDETRMYDEALAHVASQNIEIDLDDGVKVNYAKFQNVEVSKEGQKVKKINLLKKI